MSPTAVVQLSGERLELAGAASAGTVHAPEAIPVHMLDAGVTASDLTRPMEEAA